MGLAPHHRRRGLALIAVLGLAAVLYWGDASRVARLTPKGQPPLAWITPRNASAFADAFNRRADRETRVVFFFSPT